MAKDFNHILRNRDTFECLADITRLDERLQAYAAEKMIQTLEIIHATYFPTGNNDEDLKLTPIEQLMGAALESTKGYRVLFLDVLEIDPQYEIETSNGKYRTDFAIHGLWATGRTASMVIECDGHDFHEKTKQQAVRDKTRDRALTAKGYTVMHFTGSEIWRNPEACAVEVWAMFDKLAGLVRGRKPDEPNP